MELKKSIFRFKHFSCSHAQSSMKIGVDAVLLGTWVDLKYADTILDVGTGCGVIALICAQRNPNAKIEAIDIDEYSVEEATANFNASPWADRLECSLKDFNAIQNTRFDLIISNPPFYNSGISKPSSSRLIARHDDTLSPVLLLSIAKDLLSDKGRVAMVMPFERYDEVITHAAECRFSVSRQCLVKGSKKSKIKRVLLEFNLDYPKTPRESELLTIEDSPGNYTEEYRKLCKDFYLAF